MKNKIREFWTNAKEFIPEFLKWFVLTIVMFWGFATIYGMLWLGFGLPDPSWVVWIWCGLGVGSELLYFWWIANS